ncbi:O-methyltransferase [Cercophora newfieldiana]|uniref:O-methyltransferase n=1 Tax=Cercophora newfieldiana TaxID=92897 RepID=A0AA39YA51_9PEZI|nr:O-methyltransferase [Cercophora newfieldiana]
MASSKTNTTAPCDDVSAANPKIPITLTGVSETMLATLAGRAQDAAKPEGQRYLGDTWAKTVLDQLDYKRRSTMTDNVFYLSILARAKQFDIWTTEFLIAHPEGVTVLHLACGLDSRALRLNWRSPSGGKARWIDVDMPEVIALRKKVLPDPEGDYTAMDLDVTDEAWLEEIPADRPTLVVMEGLLMYLEQEEVMKLLRRVCERFPSGQILADVMGSRFLAMQSGLRTISSTGAVMKSSADYGSELAAAHEKMRVRNEVRMWQRDGRGIFPWYLRAMLAVYSVVPGFRTIASDMRFDF